MDSSWTENDIQLMAELIPLLYKDVLRLDSCRADAAILDSMNRNLQDQLMFADNEIMILDSMIAASNSVMNQQEIKLGRKEKEIVLVKKRSFWNGLKVGVGGTVVVILLFVLL